MTGLTIDSGGTLTLELREPVNGSETVRYELYSFQLFYDDFNDLVQQQYAEGIIQHYDYPEPVRTNWLLELLPFLLTAVILGLMWYFLVIRPQGVAWDRTRWPNSAPPDPDADGQGQKGHFSTTWPAPMRRRRSSGRSWSS